MAVTRPRFILVLVLCAFAAQYAVPGLHQCARLGMDAEGRSTAEKGPAAGAVSCHDASAAEGDGLPAHDHETCVVCAGYLQFLKTTAHVVAPPPIRPIFERPVLVYVSAAVTLASAPRLRAQQRAPPYS